MISCIDKKTEAPVDEVRVISVGGFLILHPHRAGSLKCSHLPDLAEPRIGPYAG